MSNDQDILNPPILEMGKQFYRLNVVHAGYRGYRPPGDTTTNSHTPETPGYQEEDLFGEDDDDEYEIEELENAVFRSSFHVPRAFYGGLIGQKGSTKKRIETDTKTEITIPGIRDTKESLVTIKGKSRSSVCTARRRVEMVIESFRKKMQPTHFTCVPACTKSIKAAYIAFKEQVLCDDFPGIDEDIFMSPEKLHITFASCTLLDDDERVRAAQIFNDCKEFLASVPPIEVTISGLEIMNDDYSSVSVLYARIDSPELQELADKILQKFKEAHLNNENYRTSSKLHMTLINVRSRVLKDPGCLDTIDARDLIKKYAYYDFGKFTVDEIHLSQMHTTGTNGFYVATGIISV